MAPSHVAPRTLEKGCTTNRVWAESSPEKVHNFRCPGMGFVVGAKKRSILEERPEEKKGSAVRKGAKRSPADVNKGLF